MFDLLKTLTDLLLHRNPQQLASISAYLLAPLLVLAVAWSSAYSHGMGFDLGRAVTITELRTDVTVAGDVRAHRGIVVTVEPMPAEYRIPLRVPAGGRLWSSLDVDAVRANADRLVLRRDGLSGKAPFLGISGPITIVVEGEFGPDLQVPGGRQTFEDLRLTARRSGALVFGVLLACVFAFGISLATGVPTAGRNQHAAR